MSADPVTLAVISFGVQAVGTYQGIQAQKARNKAIIRALLKNAISLACSSC